MSTTQPHIDDSTTSTDSFDAAAAEARSVVRFEDADFEAIEEVDEILLPADSLSAGSLTEILAFAFDPVSLKVNRWLNEPEADEVDGVKPGHAEPTRPQSVLFEAAFDGSPETTFRVINDYENRYNDEKVEIDAPAPWDTPDDMVDPNDVITGIGEWEEYHWDLDTDRGVWTLDANALDPLQTDAVDAGYEWVDDRGEDTDALDRVTELAECGDTVEVRYLKKNGNGIGTKVGEVEAVSEGERGRTQGLVIRRDDDKINRVKRGDDGEPAVRSNSQWPYMGEPVSVTIKVDE